MPIHSTNMKPEEDKKLVKFVELLVHDYLMSRGFEEAGPKFAEECSAVERCEGEAPIDEAFSWYSHAEKLGLSVRHKMR